MIIYILLYVYTMLGKLFQFFYYYLFYFIEHVPLMKKYFLNAILIFFTFWGGLIFYY